jgi:hypothetical protein
LARSSLLNVELDRGLGVGVRALHENHGAANGQCETDDEHGEFCTQGLKPVWFYVLNGTAEAGPLIPAGAKAGG